MFRSAVLCCLTIILLGCAGPTDAKAPALEKIQSATVKIKASPKVKRSVYVALHDDSRQAHSIREQIQAQLRSRGYNITEAPSAAGYILHIRLLHTGQASLDEVRRSVKQGYGTPFSSGKGTGCAVVADLLVVSRLTPRVPHSKSEVIRHSSVQTMLDRYAVRIALLQSNSPPAAMPPMQHVADMLAKHVVQLFP